MEGSIFYFSWKYPWEKAPSIVDFHFLIKTDPGHSIFQFLWPVELHQPKILLTYKVMIFPQIVNIQSVLAIQTFVELDLISR